MESRFAVQPLTDLGKCLLFYLKYPAEMEHLYDVDRPNVKGLTDSDRVLSQIKRVGDAALREGASLLEACAPGIEAHFRTISNVERVRTNLENWELKFKVSPRRATTPGKRFMIGVSIDYAPNPVALILWIGCRGGRRAQDQVIQLLGQEKMSREGWTGRPVWLSEVKIPIPERFDEPVAAEPLVAQVQQAFASFTADHVKAIGAIASNRGE